MKKKRNGNAMHEKANNKDWEKYIGTISHDTGDHDSRVVHAVLIVTYTKIATVHTDCIP